MSDDQQSQLENGKFDPCKSEAPNDETEIRLNDYITDGPYNLV